jgi:diguanylate cyclase (GGDEF)-like protein
MVDLHPDSLDPLTGALARGVLNPRLEAALASASAQSRPLSLLLVDIDYFKTVNDAFGHSRGDQVLSEFAARLLRIVRGSDSVFRYGGDEFIVLLEDADLLQAVSLAERILDQIRSTAFAGKPPITLTLCVGVAAYPRDGLNAAELFEAADRRHYLAKRSGRGMIVSSDPIEAVARRVLDSPQRVIERDNAIQTVKEFLRNLPEAEHGALAIRAERGMGRSRLLQETRKIARLMGYAVMHIAGSPALKQRCCGALHEALASWKDLPSFLVSEEAFLTGIADQLITKGQSGLLILLDDPALVDSMSMAQLQQIYFGLPHTRVGMVFVHGDTASREFPDNLAGVQEVELPPITPAGIQVWLRQALGWEADWEFIHWLHRQTSGKPGTIQRALRYLVDNRLLLGQPTGWQLHPGYAGLNLAKTLKAMPGAARVQLPIYSTQFFAFDRELTQVKQLIQSKRLIALYGPGGTGKTRLAVQAAAEIADQFRDGVFFLSFSEIHASRDMATHIAEALGLILSSPISPETQLLAALREREMLLVLDHLSHTNPPTDFIQQILALAPSVRLLVTTRAPLGIAEEMDVEVAGLHYPRPDNTAPLRSFSAVQMFIFCARRTDPDYTPDRDDENAIARICQIVQGYPLGIELAAAWVGTLPVKTIALSLKDSLALLKTQQPDEGELPPLTVDAVFDSFWSMLSAGEKKMLGSLSVFQGQFSQNAAQQVAGVSLFFLDALLGKWMLQRLPGGFYRLHALLRQYLRGKLMECELDEADLSSRHCTYYTEMLERIEPAIRGPQEPLVLEEVENAIDNIRAAWSWAIDSGHFARLNSFYVVLFQFYNSRGWLQESAAALAHAVEHLEAMPPPPDDHASWQAYGGALAYMAQFLAQLGQAEEAEKLARRALPIIQQHGTRLQEAFVLDKIGSGLRMQGKYAEAIEVRQTSLAIYQEEKDDFLAAEVLNNLAVARYSMDKKVGALGLAEESLRIFRQFGNQGKIARALNNIGLVAVELGDIERGKNMLLESLAVSRELKSELLLANVLDSLGDASVQLADLTAARRYFGEALEITWRTRALPMTLNLCVRYATVFHLEGQSERAYTLALIPFMHPASTYVYKQRAEKLLKVIETSLPQEWTAAQREIANPDRLEAAVRELLIFEADLPAAVA